ncbi:hydroxymethylpyrimidine/phosphomethylpyrimidine kinase [Methanoculleus chikugoensis]|uniref:bifunctional hydroxymethylpyrimidine kinase/phosphomethylpyrimidine kinase n=1 Tax=Methanoculleus chikugoensis TaxID=118126 RepID=UPI001FB38EB1|nr:bifunctional hydroxymethylpyrimidine kinase/phosphomethylpyrimidine kinase [Methanoculleus chikugoensis]
MPAARCRRLISSTSIVRVVGAGRDKGNGAGEAKIQADTGRHLRDDGCADDCRLLRRRFGLGGGGGAGIQADLKTFTALGVFGLTVVTAVTAQNTREVRGTWVLPPDAVRTQMEAVADDFSIGAWKTGMLGNAPIVRSVAKTLPEGAALVIDPVMISTSGHRLLAEDAVRDLAELLIPPGRRSSPPRTSRRRRCSAGCESRPSRRCMKPGNGSSTSAPVPWW